MMTKEEIAAFRKSPSPYFPVSAFEDRECERAFNWSAAISFIVYIVLAYGFTIYLIKNPDFGMALGHSLAQGFKAYGISAVETRFADLTRLDGVSGLSYIASMIVSPIVGLGLLTALVYYYYRHVLRTGKGIKIDDRAWRGVLGAAAFVAVVLWLGFFKDIGLSGNRYPGMGRIFIWPVSPMMGYSGAISIGYCGYMVICGIWKVILQWRGKLNF